MAGRTVFIQQQETQEECEAFKLSFQQQEYDVAFDPLTSTTFEFGKQARFKLMISSTANFPFSHKTRYSGTWIARSVGIVLTENNIFCVDFASYNLMYFSRHRIVDVSRASELQSNVPL